jgi:hypothetical protein
MWAFAKIMAHRAASVPGHGLPHSTRTEEAAQSRRTEAAAQRAPLPGTQKPPPAARGGPPSRTEAATAIRKMSMFFVQLRIDIGL